jgi:hypothetical protein
MASRESCIIGRLSETVCVCEHVRVRVRVCVSVCFIVEILKISQITKAKYRETSYIDLEH